MTDRPPTDAERAAHFQDLFWLSQFSFDVARQRISYLEGLLNRAHVDYELALRCPLCGDEIADSFEGTPEDRGAFLDHYSEHAEEDALDPDA